MKKRGIIRFVVLIVCMVFVGCVEESENNSVVLEGDVDPLLVGIWLFSESGREFTWSI